MDRWTDRQKDGWMNRPTDEPMDERDFIGHSPTKVECPKMEEI